MYLRIQLSGITIAAAALTPMLLAQAPTEFRGTIGQQKVKVSIVFSGDTITSAKYQYDSQKDVAPITESKSFGTTVILADEDGNVFHLHMRRANGVATTEAADATVLDGTMDREELDLPVKLERVKK